MMGKLKKKLGQSQRESLQIENIWKQMAQWFSSTLLPVAYYDITEYYSWLQFLIPQQWEVHVVGKDLDHYSC